MQINRLFEIVYILLDKKNVTSRELAERFEVSTRTIYRDVETLSAAGIPIYMKKGRGGGISLLSNFVLNKTVITDAEKEDILSSLKAIEAIDFSQTETTLNKLSSLLGEAKADWIEVDFSAWSNTQNEKDIFNMLKTAVLKKYIVFFSYASAKKQTSQREVEPLKLCFKGGAWYLYGYCCDRKDVRFFKLRRIRELSVSTKEFKRKRRVKYLPNKRFFKKSLLT